ncbi:META domain-containing protein [Pseudomonas sp. MAP12]|uniref:META domain-containing protein n=1 Tax=Geopseudomonas aromaticivorans TaxID=2849492 RepID=A0ABS6MSM1_9GAMM|nr:META domain-containing protein [Pseudomonas aromaticivorans]MBV2131550.1 META domain-containing protein [Pseudomonas aromaticivorans]
MLHRTARVTRPAILALALAGCAATPPALEQERTYRVEWIDERPLLEGSHLTITFGADDRAYGTGGCNHWFAGYGVEGEILRFSQIGSTRKACAPALMEQEARFFQALEHVRRWDLSPLEQLRLWPEQGKPIRLQPEQG